VNVLTLLNLLAHNQLSLLAADRIDTCRARIQSSGALIVMKYMYVRQTWVKMYST